MIRGANNGRYHELKNYLENAYTMGEDKFPKVCEQALGMLNHFCPANSY